MEKLKTYQKVFCEIFEVPEEILDDDFSANKFEKWDSVLQLSLVTQIEDAFDVMLEPEDIINFKSYVEGISILNKYDVNIRD